MTDRQGSLERGREREREREKGRERERQCFNILKKKTRNENRKGGETIRCRSCD
jgi:hypothetical protein